MVNKVLYREFQEGSSSSVSAEDDNDNYEEYLKHNVIHITSVTHNYYDIFIRLIGVLQVLGLLIQTIVIWYNLYVGFLSFEFLAILDLSLLSIMYIFISPNVNLLVIFGFLWLVSPILITLTASFSDDTIIALCTVAFSLYLLSHDYTIIYKDSKEIEHQNTDVVALNLSILGSILLASRLENNIQVYFFLCFSIHILYFSRMVRHTLWNNLPRVYIFVLTPITSITPIWFISYPLNIAYAIICGVIIAGTFLYVYCGLHYKNVIFGPWDVATINE
ncbi:Phosphatidylinositol N-acetylglucosaminyltransferase [Cryptosporidium felis]|nr:Phosphatidylinositol N-acetylglucosaminyltransferase [Cryptosporidium felis]